MGKLFFLDSFCSHFLVSHSGNLHNMMRWSSNIELAYKEFLCLNNQTHTFSHFWPEWEVKVREKAVTVLISARHHIILEINGMNHYTLKVVEFRLSQKIQTDIMKQWFATFWVLSPTVVCLKRHQIMTSGVGYIS